MPDSSAHQLHAFGLNHETAPIAIRERVAFPQDRLQTALNALIQATPAEEAVILSTCNRTEIYCKTPHPETVADWLSDHHDLAGFDITQYLYHLDGSAAAHHAFRVAAGLDSMVLGETQILGQVKQAVRYAEEAGTLGPLLNKMFQQTFSVAKAVRSQTAIGERSVSLASAALKLTANVLGPMEEQRVLFIGAGEMIELVATYFLARHPQAVTVANRSLERGQALATQLNGECIALTDLPLALPHHDVIISSTASHLPLIGKGMVERALRQRKHRPMVMIDLAVPRDIEPEVAKLQDVFLYTVDDLGKVTQENRDSRQLAVDEAENIITEQVNTFLSWIQSRGIVPTIRSLRDHAENYRQLELDKARRALSRGEDPAKVIEHLSQSLMNKWLHHPVQALHHSQGTRQQSLVDAIRHLFPGENT
ncbi:MAG: glutamyl-tRNA reductase [Ferrovum sp.]|nr:glutamyl-tRNA reductase [Ferrovum sp.]NDU87818.1 glutamyl-tRNA reductase [Ferrovum sp.]